MFPINGIENKWREIWGSLKNWVHKQTLPPLKHWSRLWVTAVAAGPAGPSDGRALFVQVTRSQVIARLREDEIKTFVSKKKML